MKRTHMSHRQFVAMFKEAMPGGDETARRNVWNDMVDHYSKAGDLKPGTEWIIPRHLRKGVKP